MLSVANIKKIKNSDFGHGLDPKFLGESSYINCDILTSGQDLVSLFNPRAMAG